MCLNLFTLHWDTIPWLDEIMMTDTAVNFYLDGEWRTTAWYDGGEQAPFSTYPPLYQFLLIVWMKIFGFSQFVVKSLNIFLTFLISVISIQFFIKTMKIQNVLPLFIFIILYWLGGTYAVIYRFGRVDILNILVSVLFIFYTYRYVYLKNGKLALIITSPFILLSGIQACIFVALILFWAFLFKKESRKTIWQTVVYFVMGSFASLVFLVLFFYMYGYLFAFIVSLVSYSATLKSLAVLLLPLIGPIFKLDVSSIISKVTPPEGAPSFLNRLFEAYTSNPEYLILLLLCIAIIIIHAFSKKINKNELIIFAFALMVPLFMTIAGRYVIYYTWMGYLPITFSLIYLLRKIESKTFLFVLFVSLTTFTSLTGLPKSLYLAEMKSFDEVDRFIRRQNFDVQTQVVAPFSVYFSLREETSECYFIGIYPTSYLTEVPDYIILDSIDYDSKIQNYVQELIDGNYQLTAVDSTKALQLKLYKVEK